MQLRLARHSRLPAGQFILSLSKGGNDVFKVVEI